MENLIRLIPEAARGITMSRVSFIMLLFLLQIAAASAQDLPGEFVVVDLRKDEVNYYGVDNKKAGTLTRAEHAKHTKHADAPRDVTVIGYTPDQMKAQLHVPWRKDEYIFVLATDIRVKPDDAWNQATMAMADLDEEGFCLGEAKPERTRAPDEMTHAPHALYSCR